MKPCVRAADDVADELDQMPTRRRLLKSASAGAIMAALPPAAGMLFTRFAHAASDKEVVLSMSGGSFMTNWQTKVIDPFTKLTGIKVKMVSGNIKAHAMQLRANRNDPPFDLFLGDNADFVSLIAAGTFLPLSESKVPNIKDIHPKFKDGWGGYAVGFDYSSVGLAYRTDRIKGGFNQSLRHLNQGGVQWDDPRGGQKNGQGERQCAHREVRRSIDGPSSRHSGNASRWACRARTRRRPAAFLNR